MKDLTLFNAADYLDNEEIITAYLLAAREDANPDVLSAALADVEKALAATGIQPRP